jgi:hypothetical protein
MGPTWIPDRYAFILTVVREDHLVRAHARVLGELDEGERGQLVDALRGQGLGGAGVTAGQVRTIAHLLVAAERRTPDVVLGSVPEALRERVHEAVLTTLRQEEEDRLAAGRSDERPGPGERPRPAGQPPPILLRSGEGGRRASRRPRP